MSAVKAKDIRGWTVAELEVKRQHLVKELHDLRQKRIVGQLDKPHQFKTVRKQIAQILTVKREKENDDAKR